jgi:alkanesulfonate monooxygenase SsuD/methylene tetrahydromethanopterin reductase-like flavin-dependent oxidoreductase (luciferase family)
MAATVDQVSHGRLVVGIGAAWFVPDHEAYGFDLPTERERAERLAESLQVITKLWDEPHPRFHGKYYHLENAPFAPPSVRKPHPPIIVGGQGIKWIVPLVGRYADGWNASPGVTPDGFRERVEVIRAECKKVGRDPCPSRFSAVLPLSRPAAGQPAPAASGAPEGQPTPSAPAWSSDATTARVREFVAAGANEIILILPSPYDRASLARIAHEVVPAVRSASAP